MTPEVYIADICGIIEKGLYDKYYSRMPHDRQVRCSRFKFEEDRLRCVAAYELLRRALNGFVPPIYYSDKGKPYFSGCSDVFFNFSHSGTKVMCAVADVEIGCDVEKKRNDRLNIAKRFFHDDEFSYLESKSAAGKNDFTKLWSLKESILKCSGDGIGYQLNSFSLLDKGLLREYIILPDSDIKYYIKCFEEDDEYEYTVCAVCPVDGLEAKKLIFD